MRGTSPVMYAACALAATGTTAAAQVVPGIGPSGVTVTLEGVVLLRRGHEPPVRSSTLLAQTLGAGLTLSF